MLTKKDHLNMKFVNQKFAFEDVTKPIHFQVLIIFHVSFNFFSQFNNSNFNLYENNPVFD